MFPKIAATSSKFCEFWSQFLSQILLKIMNFFFWQVDDYEPVEYNFNIKASADAQFNNIQYMYIGKNHTMNEGFIGCVSRVEFDDIYPLKLLFQQDGPENVRSFGGNQSFHNISFSWEVLKWGSVWTLLYIWQNNIRILPLVS